MADKKEKIKKLIQETKAKRVKKDLKGPGSRGGTILGYTKTGNPIYGRRAITGVTTKDPTEKIVGKEKQRREARKEKKTDAAHALPKGQRKKIQNLIAKLRAKKEGK